MSGVGDPVSVASAVIAFAALVAAGLSARSSMSSARYAKQSALRDSMQLYLHFYLNAVESNPFIFSEDSYYKNPATAAKSQVIAGLLVGVIEQMIINKDIRLDRWKNFIAAIPGPLKDPGAFDLRDYASLPETRQLIDELKKIQ
jgi:hypothetical protein